MDNIKEYFFEKDNVKYFAVLKFLKDFGINRSIINNKKWANPIFRRCCKILNFKGKKGQSRITMMPFAIGMLFLLTIKINKSKNKSKELEILQQNIISILSENNEKISAFFCFNNN